SATSWTSMVPCSSRRTARRAWCMPTATSTARRTCGARRTWTRERARRAACARGVLAETTAGPGDPVPDADVGDLLLLRHAHAARVLHDEAAALRAAACVAGLWRVRGDVLLHADHRRRHFRSLARSQACGDHRRGDH